jgi:glycosyltransferase involved in cell wall biosynthesis
MSTVPAVSVVIPTYNRADHIGDAIDSVLGQTVPVAEIIVVDDGSTDDTASVVARFGNRLRYIKQENAGPSTARNRGVKEATGDFVAFQDSDDIWLPRKTELQLQFFAANPDADVVFGLMANVTSVDDNLLVPEIRNPAVHDELVRPRGCIDDMFRLLLLGNVIPTPTVMIRRRCFNQAGGFDPELLIAEDWDFYLRLSNVCRFGFINQVLLKRRRHEGNLINDRSTRLNCTIKVLKQLPDRFPEAFERNRSLIDRQMAACYYELGSLHFRNRHYQDALACLLRWGPLKRRKLACAAKILLAAMLGLFESRTVIAK